MKYRVFCSRLQTYVPLDVCEMCVYFDGIAVRDDRAFLKGLPNCDLVACKYDHALRPIIHDTLKEHCSYCPLNDCPWKELIMNNESLKTTI